MRSNLDGSQMETLIDTSGGDPRPGPDARKWCVGIAVDAHGGKIYWTQKGPAKGGQGRLFRANISIPQGQTAANRKDIELLYDDLPEPIDLGPRYRQPDDILDRSGRSTARQHRQSGAYGCAGEARGS